MGTTVLYSTVLVDKGGGGAAARVLIADPPLIERRGQPERMHKVYAPSRAPNLLHGSYAENVQASRSPASWEEMERSSWSRTSASSVAEIRMAGAAPFRPRISRPRTAGSLPRLNMDAVLSRNAEEGQRSSRAWSASGWSPPPRKAAKNTRAPLSLNDVQNKKAIADATQLRQFEDQMAGYGPFPDARVARQRQRRAWNQIDQKLRAEAENTERSLVYNLTTPRITEQSAAQIKDAERRKKGRKRAEAMAKTTSANPPRPITPIMAGSPPSGDVRTEPKRLPSGEIIDPQEHIARPSQDSPYKHAVMPERFVSTTSKPARPPAQLKKADGRVVEKHTASGKFGVDNQEAAVAVSLLFAAVQDANDGVVVPDAPAAQTQRPPTPGGSVIGIPGYQYDRRPHTDEEVEKLRAAQVTAQEAGNYTRVAILADQIIELASPEEYKALQKKRADAAAARAAERQQQLEEEGRQKAQEEARERKATEEQAAAAIALAAQLLRESMFAEQQQALLKEEQRRRLWQQKRPAPNPEHRHSHMWEAKPEAALRPAVWSSPPRKIALIES